MVRRLEWHLGILSSNWREGERGREHSLDDKDLDYHDEESGLRHRRQMGRRQIRKPAPGTSLVVQWLGRSPGEGIGYPFQYAWASPVAQTVKNLPAMRRPGFHSWVGKIPLRRAWQPTPVFLPGESHGQRSLAGYSPWGRESDMTEQLSTHEWLRICLPMQGAWV